MMYSRSFGVRVNDVDLCKVIAYLQSIQADTHSLGTVGRRCIELVAAAADASGKTWTGEASEANAMIQALYGKQNSGARQVLTAHKQHLSNILAIGQQSAPVQFCGIPESERIFRSPEEDAQFRDYCMLHKLEPFEDIQPEEWREKLKAQNRHNMERYLEQQNEREALGSIPGNVEVVE